MTSLTLCMISLRGTHNMWRQVSQLADCHQHVAGLNRQVGKLAATTSYWPSRDDGDPHRLRRGGELERRFRLLQGELTAHQLRKGVKAVPRAQELQGGSQVARLVVVD